MIAQSAPLSNEPSDSPPICSHCGVIRSDIAPSPTGRTLLARFLDGAGVEVGPGHHPLAIPYPGVSVRYVDRWRPDESLELFTNVESGAAFTAPDIVANLDVDGLAALDDASQDFVIASHLLEHLADPLRQLGEIHRVLRVGGIGLLFLPDRRYTFDRRREATPLEHLVADHEDHVTFVSDVHVEDYLRKTDDWDDSWTDDERQSQFELHRRRSIHAHCWTQDEFLEVIVHTVGTMDMQWELLDALFIEDVGGGSEFGMALRRGRAGRDPAVEADRLRLTWEGLRGRAQERAALEQQLVRFRSIPGYPVVRGAWRLQRRLRRAGN